MFIIKKQEGLIRYAILFDKEEIIMGQEVRGPSPIGVCDVLAVLLHSEGS